MGWLFDDNIVENNIMTNNNKDIDDYNTKAEMPMFLISPQECLPLPHETYRWLSARLQ